MQYALEQYVLFAQYATIIFDSMLITTFILRVIRRIVHENTLLT
jgi:hypothetical protein